MQINILKDFRGLKKGQTFPLIPNQVNYWVGKNGTGKTTLASLLLSFMQRRDKKLVPSHLWKATLSDKGIIEFADWKFFTSLSFVSDKLRQTQYVDMTALINMGLGRLWLSEGQDAQQNIVEMSKHVKKPNHLTILDEADGHLDYPSKVVLFDHLLPKMQGTVIVITHDSFFLVGKQVLDFNDGKIKNGFDYYEDEKKRLYSMKASKPAEQGKVIETVD